MVPLEQLPGLRPNVGTTILGAQSSVGLRHSDKIVRTIVLAIQIAFGKIYTC